LAIVFFSWLFKFYFALLVYSYASHLRKGSYRTLPFTRPVSNTPLPFMGYETSLADEDEEVEDFYRVPLRKPQSGSSITSFSDFVSAPGRVRKPKGHSRLGKSSLGKGVQAILSEQTEDGDILFDDNEVVQGQNSRLGIEESGSSSLQDGDRLGSRNHSRTHSRSHSRS